MKNHILILLFLAITLSFFSCKQESDEKIVNTVQDETIPPSLRQGEEGMVLLNLSEKEQRELDIQTVTIKSSRVDYPVSAPGVIFSDPDHISIISVPVDGQVSVIKCREGQWVNSGDVLFSIRSLEFGSMVSDYMIAYAEQNYQYGRLERIKQLVEETISSESQLEQALSDYNRASVNMKASLSKLKAIGISDSELEQYTSSDDIDPVLRVYAPISGTVAEMMVEQGQSVQALENLSRIVDNRVILVRGYLSPDDARLVQPGDKVIISRREDRTLLLESTVSSVNPGLDEKSMSVVVNISANTIKGWPKPGENVHLSIVTRVKNDIVVVPYESLTYDGNDAVVFVSKDVGTYEKRVIEILDIGEKNVFVRNGLQQGEEVAVSQVSSLKALSRFDVISGN